jgi:hypothetical protein
MLRRCSCIALAVMLLGLPTAQAADTTLMLACKGTSTFKVKGTAKTEPLQIGIVIDLAKRTIRGLLLDTSETVPINDFTDLSIEFGGAFPSGSLSASMYGSLDRVTGDYLATEFYRNGASVEYSMKCRPAQRMF